MKWYLLHPAVVHFPIALLTIGWAAVGAERLLTKEKNWLDKASSWLLWLGTLTAWAAMGLGLLAEKTAEHVPAAWKVLADHKALAFWTVGLFTALSLWKKIFPNKLRKSFLIAWTLSLGVLAATAWHGGEIVYTYGMGVATANSN